MTTRLVCIGDCHFGPQGGRNEDRYRSLDQIIQAGLAIAEHGELGAWLFAGDLNHAKMTIEDRNALAPRLQGMAALAPILMIRGNHDLDGDPEIFTRLTARYPIQYVTTPQVVHLRLATGDVAAVFCQPYVFRAGLVSAGVQHADLGQTARAALEPIFIAAAAELDQARAAAELTLMLAHMNIGGAVSSVGQPQIGQEIELDPALLARLGAVPKLFGHIHRHQRVHDAYFIGSIARMDFGENEEKVFGVLSWTGTEWALEFDELDVPEQLHIEGVLTRERFQFEHDDWVCRACHGDGDGAIVQTDDADRERVQCETCHGSGRRSWQGADIRVRYRYVKAEIGALDVAKIHAEFAGCRSLKLDPVPVLAHEVRAPEIAAAPTLEAKVQAYCERHGIAWTPALAAKLIDLQRLDGAALLTSVTTSLAAAGAQPGDVEGAPVTAEVA